MRHQLTASRRARLKRRRTGAGEDVDGSEPSRLPDVSVKWCRCWENHEGQLPKWLSTDPATPGQGREIQEKWEHTVTQDRATNVHSSCVLHSPSPHTQRGADAGNAVYPHVGVSLFSPEKDWSPDPCSITGDPSGQDAE